ncbi:mesothelin-like protein [Clupea harengus]|uniref:Mesothelin-like protein n=1 Tax=Clupea harengus TaxID=7950 RepID=A0A8M1K6J3_CLUHA|nr:mesothelin-like protein [Clupea harengus]
MDTATDISFQVLQGFTCTRVESFTKIKVKSLIRGCRRRKSRKLKLKQSQLTCMYYYMKGESDATDYSLFPADVLLYYDYSTVTNCSSYFTELGFADFSVLSNVYESTKTTLLSNAKTCLNITGFNIGAANIDILGNMVCQLNSSYVQDSDPSILEKLKNCDDLTSSLISGMETLLLSGETKYGVSSRWTQQTLEDLDILPLYFTSTLWREIKKRDGRRFLKSFIKELRLKGTSRKKIRTLKRAFRTAHRAKRDASIECTVGTITQVEINDDTFPIDYDATQFNACLSVATLKNNLPAITDKADEDSYHQIILEKLNQAYPEGISDNVVQMLGPASRGATTDDISKWNVTNIDTLSSLLKTSDGDWADNQTEAIMTKYLAAGQSIDSSALNSLGGSGLCALDTSVLETVTSSSLKQADALTTTSCSLTKKKALFPIALAAFVSTAITKRSTTTVTSTQYQLIQSYLGGATESFVRTLTSSSINMDMDTFIALDQSVIQCVGRFKPAWQHQRERPERLLQ